MLSSILNSFDPKIAASLAWFISFVALSLALVIFLGSKKRSSRIFALASFVTALWIFVMGLYVGISNQNITEQINCLMEFIPRLTYFLGSIIAMLFFYFCAIFLNKENSYHWMTWVFLSLIILTFPLYFYTDLIVAGQTEWISNNNIVKAEIWEYSTGPLNIFYMTFFNLLFGTGTYFIYRKTKILIDPKQRTQLRFMFWTLIIGFIPPSIVSILLPMLDIYEYLWIGALSPIIWISVISYSIMKYDQMNVRVVFTEILVLAAALILFINIFV